MKKTNKILFFIALLLPLSVVGQTYTFDAGGNGYYDATTTPGTWTNLSLYNGGTVGTANTVTTTPAGTTILPSTVFHPLTYNTTTVSSADLTAIPSSNDCEVVWTDYLNSAADGIKSGMILRAQSSATNPYSTSARPGYYFLCQHSAVGSFRLRIQYLSSTLGSGTGLADVTVSPANFTKGPLFLKAKVKGTALTFSYSTDNISWTASSTATTSTNGVTPYTSGTVQLAWGYGGGSTIDAYIDDVTYTNLDVPSVKLVGDDKYLYDGSAKGASISTNAFFAATPTVTYKYKGIGSTTYDESTDLPSAVGTYMATADATNGTQNAKDTLAYEIYTPNTENTYSYTFSADNVGATPANITYASGAGNVQSITGRMFPTASPYFSGYKTTGKMFVPTTAGALNGTAVANLTSISSSSSYSLIWKEYYSAVGSKKGFLLQGQADECPYATGLKKGYLFTTVNNGATTDLRIYIATVNTVDASNITTNNNGLGFPTINNISAPVNPGANIARWYRATVKPSVQTFEYSNDGVNWVLATSMTDATYSGKTGITQSVAGFGAGLGTFGYDYIGYKDVPTSVNSIAADSNPLVLTLGAGSIAVQSGNFIVYSAQGLKIKEVKNNNSSNIVNLHTGVYIVKSGTKVQKVVVE